MSEQKELKSMRVYVTERCNANCKSCFNAMSRTNAEMPVDAFLRLCKYLKENGITFLKIMGGEPTIHNDFEKIVEIAQEYFSGLSLFTNGINKRIKKVSFRETDSVVFNFSFNKLLNEESLYLGNGGRRSLEIQIHSDTDEIELTKRIIDIAKIDRERIHISLTLDCTSNIFLEKQTIVKKLRYIEQQLFDNDFKFGYDHRMPLCYLYKTGLHPSGDGICSFPNSGLIGADLKLRFCNQHNEKILNLVDDGRFLPWTIVKNHLRKRYFELQAESLNKICSECIFYGEGCNGGCWIANDKISYDDIINNTDFPLRKAAN